MHLSVGDASLFVEVVGTKLRVIDGGVQERPTIVFLHGGPAWDHLALLPELRPLEDMAQLIFYDHRGLGRSDVADASSWNLRQWAADLMRLIEVLGLDRPIIFGQSFGGMVAQRFAIDFPEAYSRLILSSTAARFDLEGVLAIFRRLGGPEMERLARSFFTAASAEDRDRFLVEGMPFYTVNGSAIGALSPFKPDVLDHFFSAEGDARRFDFRAELERVRAPTLIIGGDQDPVIPPQAMLEMADSFADGVAKVEIFDRCGHGPTRDRPEEALNVIREFIAEDFSAGPAPSAGRRSER